MRSVSTKGESSVRFGACSSLPCCSEGCNIYIYIYIRATTAINTMYDVLTVCHVSLCLQLLLLCVAHQHSACFYFPNQMHRRARHSCTPTCNTNLLLFWSRNKVWHVSALRGLGVNSAPIPSVLDTSHMQLLPDDLPLHGQKVFARSAPWNAVVGSFHGAFAAS